MAAVILSALTACEREISDQRPAAACSLPPEIRIPEDVPPDFPWLEGVSVTQAELKKEFVSVTGFGERSVEEFFDDMRAELTEKNFDIINTDFEGFEAELYFAKGDGLAGISALREGPCDGFVRVSVVYDPLETAEGREAVRKTRRLTGGDGRSND